MKSVFVSYVYEDASHKEDVVGWGEARRLGPVQVTSERRDVRQDGERRIKRELSPLLKGAAAVVVLIGNDTHNSQWVGYEVQHALSHHKQIIPVRLPGTRGAAPSAIRGVAEVAFDPESLRRALGT